MRRIFIICAFGLLLGWPHRALADSWVLIAPQAQWIGGPVAPYLIRRDLPWAQWLVIKSFYSEQSCDQYLMNLRDQLAPHPDNDVLKLMAADGVCLSSLNPGAPVPQGPID